MNILYSVVIFIYIIRIAAMLLYYASTLFLKKRKLGKGFIRDVGFDLSFNTSIFIFILFVIFLYEKLF